ncbi:DJ-1/PfpI family protein [Maricurvus nonylphenolicus]|uniref:DJ-1/PfpI family protein n=1 Tax=Maricurvus nonylphenolicus TaxID=1008307 RepID=UPI0036F1D744
MKPITFFIRYALLITLLSTHTAQAATEKIGVLVFPGFLTSDVTAPLEVFGAASRKAWFSSYEVILVSATREHKITSEEGLQVVANNTIYDDLQLDVLILPSAYEMDDYISNTELIRFITTQGRTASWMASNCSGAFLLAEAGLLDGKKATTWAGGEKSLARAYPKVDVQYDQNIVVDNRVITSNGGPVSYQSAFALLAKLSSETFAEEISQAIQFDRLARAFPR